MSLSGIAVVMPVENMVNDLEFWYPYYRLREEGAAVTVVGSGSAKTYSGKAGIPVTVDAAAGDINIGDVDGIVIPGGYAPDLMRRYPDMVGLVRSLHQEGKVVAAICHAGWMLASAKILQGRTVTSFFAIKDDLIHAGADWVDQEVVIDGRLITSRTPDDLPAFMKAVVSALRDG